jgi:hypothetical protein
VVCDIIITDLIPIKKIINYRFGHRRVYEGGRMGTGLLRGVLLRDKNN